MTETNFNPNPIPSFDKNQELIEEIKKLTHQLKIQNDSWRQIGKSFTKGLFTSLGSLLGFIIIFSLSSYFILRLPFVKNMIDSFQNLANPGNNLNLYLPFLQNSSF